MKILMTSLFDPDRRDGITNHEASIVTRLTRKLPMDEAVILTKAPKENVNLPAAVAQFGSARRSIFHDQSTMTAATARLLMAKLTGSASAKFPPRSSYVLIGYHWVFWLPFLRSAKKIVFVPFDCWSAREIRVAKAETRFLRKYGRYAFGLVLRCFERLSAGHIDLFGFVSREEIEKYVQGLNARLRSRILSRSAILPMAEYSDFGSNREILAGETPRLLIWMDGRVGYGVKSIAACVAALEKWAALHAERKISVTLLTRRSDAEMRDILAPNPGWKNIEFVEGDLAGYLSTFDIVILPDLNGSGLKNRTVQSIGCGAAVVATPMAAEGLSPELRGSIHVIAGLEALGQALDGIFADRASAREMANAARGILALESQDTGERAEFFDKVALALAD